MIRLCEWQMLHVRPWGENGLSYTNGTVRVKARHDDKNRDGLFAMCCLVHRPQCGDMFA